MGFSKRDLLQVAAFHLRYRLLSQQEEYAGKPDLLFIQTICETSDDRFAEANPELIEEWIKTYSARRPKCTQ